MPFPLSGWAPFDALLGCLNARGMIVFIFLFRCILYTLILTVDLLVFFLYFFSHHFPRFLGNGTLVRRARTKHGHTYKAGLDLVSSFMYIGIPSCRGPRFQGAI